ncbi:ABC transporter permease [Sanguibacter sp. Leaf3]|uniref:ABC transporter permease n=1 Tax=Sanguibacter sp. Leaf3 TaxID=1736209 RepID=UPI0006F40244|nr:ABC transporter permease [Sanguibacter sp. Leaf3]KQT99520.1 ABC transporter permease [Sanguibacter sp. Leaf3]
MADDIREQQLAAQASGGGIAPAQIIEETPTAVTAGRVEKVGAWRRFGQLLRRSPKLAIGLAMVIAIVLFTVIVPFFTESPTALDNASLLRPGEGGHLLGTTQLGADVLAQLAHGGRSSLLIGLGAGFITVVLSVFFGVVGGYLGGWTDEVLFFISSIMLVIPGLPLLIVVSSYIPGRSIWLFAVLLGVTSWAGSAIVLRSQARSLRNRDYVAAARVAGENPWRIIFVEIIPNLLPLAAAQFLFAVVAAILGEAGLSFLGLGPTGGVTWGTMLNDAQQGAALTRGAWWWFIPPGILIALLGGALSLVNFSIDEIINPKLRTGSAQAKSVREARRKHKESRRAAKSARAEQKKVTS